MPYCTKICIPDTSGYESDNNPTTHDLLSKYLYSPKNRYVDINGERTEHFNAQMLYKRIDKRDLNDVGVVIWLLDHDVKVEKSILDQTKTSLKVELSKLNKGINDDKWKCTELRQEVIMCEIMEIDDQLSRLDKLNKN